MGFTRVVHGMAHTVTEQCPRAKLLENTESQTQGSETESGLTSGASSSHSKGVTPVCDGVNHCLYGLDAVTANSKPKQSIEDIV